MKPCTMKTLLCGLAWVVTPVCYAIYLGSMKWLKVKNVDIPSDKAELKILLIADLHSNSRTRMNLDIWETINKLNFDMAVLTGDVILNLLCELTPHIRELRALARRVPVFFVEGNHEILYKDDLCALFSKIGVTPLYNERVTREINNSRLSIVGLRDYYFLQSKKFEGVDEIFRDVSPNAFNLVLSHQPQIFDRTKKYPFDLMLSGHTHGGQLRLPLLPTLYAPGQGLLPKYGDGLYEQKGRRLYISRGVGTTVFPIRFFNRPEITLLNIHRGKGSKD